MSIILQNYPTIHNKIARKAMEDYVGILQKAFDHYQNFWEDYIKLQEKCKQCNVCSNEMTVNTPCMNTTNETISQHSNDIHTQESIPLLKLDTINGSPINSGTGLSDTSESVQNIDELNRPTSPVFSKTFQRTGKNSAKKFVGSSKAVYDNSTSDMKTQRNDETVPSKYNHRLEISTTHHVETTFLPDGKRLKQSRLVFHPVKCNEKIIDKYKEANVLHNREKNFDKDISIINATATENSATSSTSEISEDVIEISPSQKNISRVKRYLKLKALRKKAPVKHMKRTPSKCSDPEIIDDIIDFGLCLSPKDTSSQLEYAKSLTNDALKEKVNVNVSYLSPIMHNKTDNQIKKSIKTEKENLLTNEIQKNEVQNNFACGDETFYLPAEQDLNRSDVDNFNSNDAKHKPPKRNILKRKADIPEQLNMRRKADRAKLDGWDCWECKQYYKNLSLSEEDLQKRKNQCSRHRRKYERPNTPEGFWDPVFPETMSCSYRQNRS